MTQDKPRGRPGTRRKWNDPMCAARMGEALNFLEIAFCQPTKDGVIQAFAEVAADQFRQMQIDGIRFDAVEEYRFGKE